MKRLVIICAIVTLVIPAYGYQNVYFNDGSYHKIDYIIDGKVHVDQGFYGVGTQLELVDGGAIAPGQGYGDIEALNDCQITVSGGEIGWSILAIDRSKINMAGGYIESSISSSSIITVSMSGGSVKTLVANQGGSFNVSGGTIRWAMETQGNTYATISGGYIARINCLDSSRIDVSGGTIAGKIYAGYYGDATSLITLHGRNFAINGNPIFPNTYVSSYSNGGWITGILADGSTLNTSFELNGRADILVIPEPTSIILLGLGGLMLRKRK